MEKTIRPGQLVTFGNVIYEAKKCTYPERACSKCDLNKRCPDGTFDFVCNEFIYFKYVTTKHFPKTRRCKRV